jgi:hypothetical protein
VARRPTKLSGFDHPVDFLLEIEVAGERTHARCTMGALYDRKSGRIKM